MGVDARAELMFESYNNLLQIEACTLVQMIETGILPACAKDLASFSDMPDLAGERADVYGCIRAGLNDMKALLARVPHDVHDEASYYCDVIKPQMEKLRSTVDTAEGFIPRELYPYPTYEALV